MTPNFEYSKLSNSQDVKRLNSILEQCFVSPPGEGENYAKALGVENFRVVRHQGEIAGGFVAIHHLDQWWGGECVPMSGIAGLGIAPEHRGSGAALTMIQSAIKELYSSGVAISVLYPATQRLYRKAGYEQAGSYCNWEIPTNLIQIHEQPLSIKPLANDDKILHELYEKQARHTNGYLKRNQPFWQHITQPEPESKQLFHVYQIGESENPQGYIIISQHRTEANNYIEVRDWVVLTKAAYQSFWLFLANHRSVIDVIKWRDSPSGNLAFVLPEKTAKLKSSKCWMLRVVDVVKALEKRGYPNRVQAELHLEVKDDLIAENNGKFILSIANGSAEVTKGGKSELQLDISGLAPLYTGLLSAQQLQLMGKLEGSPTAINTVTQIFAGTSPWMPDFF